MHVLLEIVAAARKGKAWNSWFNWKVSVPLCRFFVPVSFRIVSSLLLIYVSPREDNIQIMISKRELPESLQSGPLLTLLHEYFLTLLFYIVTRTLPNNNTCWTEILGSGVWSIFLGDLLLWALLISLDATPKASNKCLFSRMVACFISRRLQTLSLWVMT